MNAPLAHTAWEPCLLEPIRNPVTEAWLRREAGSAPPFVRYFLGCPWIAKSLLTLNADHGVLAHIDFAIADIIALVVSQENSCRYCYAATRLQLRMLGLSEERLQALEQQLAGADLDPRTAAAVRFARHVARASPLAGAEAWAALRDAGFSEGEAAEIAFLAAIMAYFNRLSTMSALPPQLWEELADRWYMRLLQPLMAPMMRRMRRRGHVAAAVTPPAVPFGGLVLDLRASPAARALAAILGEAWNSPLLAPRAKLLMLAVIAHGLGGTRAQQEAARWAAQQGIGEAELPRLLAELGGSGRREPEPLLMEFARDSIWYEPQTLQQRTRGLREQIEGTALVEAMGIAALGNALCRLAAVLPAAA